ncbi:sodium:proton antiporter [Verticiella sediminum]|uniref:Sodium:proton antiporter n=1 Tax=Verticiella sediminum TaxID=1247510 RepID=A0A556AKQ0_9BURK|nr:Na+/H+ antiporter subunit E [Verticiella sediminum]TSH93450.1 sodium:proton antiporter [Verticiella sediminum]
MSRLSRLGDWARLLGRFFIDLVLSVKEVVLAVFEPRRASRSGIVAIPLDVKSEAGIALLANMVTLTPGTTSLHVSEDGKTLYVHVMNLSDDTVEQVKAGFEAHVRKVLP